MKKQIAKWLVGLAGRLDPEVEKKDGYVARQVGIGIHIAKSDVRKFRKLNPQFTSHRKGLTALIEDAKNKALMNILAALKENDVVEYDVHRTPWVADVKVSLKVYVRNDGEESIESEAAED